MSCHEFAVVVDEAVLLGSERRQCFGRSEPEKVLGLVLSDSVSEEFVLKIT